MDKLPVLDQMKLLKMFIGEAGYNIFDVEESVSRTALDIIAANINRNTCPAWIYPSEKGRIVIRPFVGKYESDRLQVRIPASYKNKLRLIKSWPLPPKKEWWEMVSPESRKEARILGFNIPA